MEELLAVFVQESREQLAAMEAALLQLEAHPEDPDLINAVFRPAHTIKGGAGVIECDFIVGFTHVVENALDMLREGKIAVSGELVAVLLQCCDHIGLLFDVLESGAKTPTEALQTAGEKLIKKLDKNWPNPQEEQQTASANPATPTPGVLRENTALTKTECWHISVRFGTEVLRQGMDPLSFLRYLATLGSIEHLETLADGMPVAEEMDPECCYLGFEITFRSDADKASIEAVFDFVREDCTLYILPPHSRLEEYIDLVQTLPEDNLRLGEILVRIGALTEAELARALGLQEEAAQAAAHTLMAGDGSARPPLGSILVEQGGVAPELVEAAVVRQKQVAEKRGVEARLIRIQADKLDKLIDLVGELVISGASVNLLAGRSGLGELVEATSLMSRLVESIRDSALQLRMVQIGETFNRFNRVVRDVSRELNKDIELVITGGETELDKSMVEKIADPLMHLVRNAMDHGIESTETRLAQGKSERGRLELNAYHDSGSVIIEVADDGGGLDRERILAKAVERGLVQPGQTLSDTEIYNLIFEAGFSTAAQVTNLSGRGVGMDVVRRNIQSLRGTVDIASQKGEGTQIAIRLPLTLAIIDGFLVGIDTASYVIPLDAVVECIELGQSHEERDFLNLRGEVLPFVRLRELFEIHTTPPLRQNVVVVQFAGQKAGIVVDQLIGEFQTVIKPLGQIFRHVRGIGGSTILGSGEVALILDVQALIARCSGVEERRQPDGQRS